MQRFSYPSPTLWAYSEAPPTTVQGTKIFTQDLQYFFYLLTTPILFSALWRRGGKWDWRGFILLATQCLWLYLCWMQFEYPDGEINWAAIMQMYCLNFHVVWGLGMVCGDIRVARGERGLQQTTAELEGLNSQAANMEQQNSRLRRWVLVLKKDRRPGCVKRFMANTSDRTVAIKMAFPLVISTLALSGPVQIPNSHIYTNQAIWTLVWGVTLVYAVNATRPTVPLETTVVVTYSDVEKETYLDREEC